MMPYPEWALGGALPRVGLGWCPTRSGPWVVPYLEWALGGALPRVGLGGCPTRSGPWVVPYPEWALGGALPRASTAAPLLLLSLVGHDRRLGRSSSSSIPLSHRESSPLFVRFWITNLFALIPEQRPPFVTMNHLCPRSRIYSVSKSKNRKSKLERRIPRGEDYEVQSEDGFEFRFYVREIQVEGGTLRPIPKFFFGDDLGMADLDEASKHGVKLSDIGDSDFDFDIAGRGLRHRRGILSMLAIHLPPSSV
ncbi:hypothetical protein U1Q18_016567 [Sarracenia purpurea var. burkii]